MKVLVLGCVALLATMLLLPAAMSAADDATSVADAWPREITSPNGDRLTVHQPQVDRWADDALEARVAVALQWAGEADPVYGALWVRGETRTNLQTRVVTLGKVRILEARFPATGSHTEAQTIERLRALLPAGPVDIALDRLLANVERTQAQSRARETELGPVVPEVIVEQSDARLVLIDGEPVLAAVEGTGLLHVVNTDWHVLLEQGTGVYFLRLGDGWVMAPDLRAPAWTRAPRPPQDLARIPATHPRAEARQTAVDARAPMPAIHVRTAPAELVLLDGPARLASIAGTSLLYVLNTQSDLFMHVKDSRWYLLAAGRWLQAPALSGPWTSVPGDLPADFQHIPSEHPKAGVLTFVRGTPAAEEALILAQIPHRAVIERASTSVEVTYDGAPRFERCAGSAVAYAVNSPFDVVLVEGRYYCCYQGVWFVAVAALGPWSVCDHVPQVIYTIGPRCPVYRVTYVYVYDATPTLVMVGYLPGYLGLYVSPRRRVVVFGTGWSYRPWIRAGVWFGWPLTFGLGVSYHPYVSGFVFGVTYYTPLVRRPMRATWYPYTARYHTRYQTTSAYARWGSGVIHRYDEWLRRSHVIGTRGTLSGFGARTPRPAAGARAPTPARPGVAPRAVPGTRSGPSVRPSAPRPGTSSRDLYVGGDGNVYRRSGTTWQRYDGRTWRALPRGGTAVPRSGTTPRTGTTPRAGTTPRTAPTPGAQPPTRRTPPSVRSGLERDARNRQLGSQRVRLYETWRRQAPSIRRPPRTVAPSRVRPVRPPSRGSREVQPRGGSGSGRRR